MIERARLKLDEFELTSPAKFAQMSRETQKELVLQWLHAALVVKDFRVVADCYALVEKMT